MWGVSTSSRSVDPGRGVDRPPFSATARQATRLGPPRPVDKVLAPNRPGRAPTPDMPDSCLSVIDSLPAGAPRPSPRRGPADGRRRIVGSAAHCTLHTAANVQADYPCTVHGFAHGAVNARALDSRGTPPRLRASDRLQRHLQL
jgi:hypothetical protein